MSDIGTHNGTQIVGHYSGLKASQADHRMKFKPYSYRPPEPNARTAGYELLQ